MNHVWECLSCHGRYVDAQTDGSLYFHACPPLRTSDARRLSFADDAVDENISIDAAAGAVRPKKAGAGRRELTTAELAAFVASFGPPPAAPATPGLLARAGALLLAPLVRLFHA